MTVLRRQDLYDGPHDLVWLLHANHMGIATVLGLGADFDGPPGGQTHGAFAPGETGRLVVPGRSRPIHDYRVTALDPAAGMAETLETRWPARRWRRRHVVTAAGEATRVEETVVLEGPLAPLIDRARSVAWSDRRARAIADWLASPAERRAPLPANARAPLPRSPQKQRSR